MFAQRGFVGTQRNPAGHEAILSPHGRPKVLGAAEVSPARLKAQIGIGDLIFIFPSNETFCVVALRRDVNRQCWLTY